MRKPVIGASVNRFTMRVLPPETDFAKFRLALFTGSTTLAQAAAEDAEQISTKQLILFD